MGSRCFFAGLKGGSAADKFSTGYAISTESKSGDELLEFNTWPLLKKIFLIDSWVLIYSIITYSKSVQKSTLIFKLSSTLAGAQ